MPSRVQEKIDWLNGQINSRLEWLRTHGTRLKPWPETDIESKRAGLEIMTDIRDDYQKSVEAKVRQAAAE